MKFNPIKHYVGNQCKNGHTIRWKSTDACAECKHDRSDYLKTYNKQRLTKPKPVATALFLACRNRQRKKYPHAPFNLTKKWIQDKIEFGKCEVTGLPFCLDVLLTSKRPFAPSIDKTDPSKHYTQDNCKVVCYIYNVAKSEFAHDDVLKLASALCS